MKNNLLVVFFGTLLAVSTLLIANPALPVEPETPTLTGAWYDADNPGHGVFVDEVPGVGTFVAWFTYGFGFEPTEQYWYVGGSEADDHGYSFGIGRAEGNFPADNVTVGPITGRVSFDVLENGDVLFVWHFAQEPPCVTPRVSPSPPWCDGSVVLTRLFTAPAEE